MAENKIDKKELQEEIAAPSLVSIRSTWKDSIANSLTPEVLAQVLLGVDQNLFSAPEN